MRGCAPCTTSFIRGLSSVRRRVVTVLLGVGGILAIAVILLLPPRRTAAPPAQFTYRWPVVEGAYHVHSSRSDGTGSVDEIAAAAAAAGLQFVITTDHGDGTRAPDAPSYRSGVLCIDAVEISTTEGHYVALGLAQTPYRLAGRPRDVIEDVTRFGGFGIAAHPGSPKAALAWTDWEARFDGLEWLNADSEWRDEFWTSLGRVLLTYAFRPTETLAALLDKPSETLRQWDRAGKTRHVIGLAGADAHARLGLRDSTEPYEDRTLARLPSYEASFRAFSNQVILDEPLTGHADSDARKLLEAIRQGRVFTSIDGAVSNGALEVKAVSGATVARPGESLDSTSPIRIEVALAAPPGTSIVVLRDGVPIHQGDTGTITVDVGGEPAAYRVEAYLPEHMHAPKVPWLLTNPIYVNLRAANGRPPASAPSAPIERTGVEAVSWQTESSADSRSVVVQAGAEKQQALTWQLSLGGGPAVSQFAAMALPLDQKKRSFERVIIRARADRHLRLSAQLRLSPQRGGLRWAKSFHIGPEVETIDLRFEDFRPLGPMMSERPPLADVEGLLIVADTLNTLPGTAAAVSCDAIWLAK
jgi:hypothetical protein